MTLRTTYSPKKPPDMIANRYRVEKTLGRGGMAMVYEVIDISTGKRLALKQMHKRSSDINIKKKNALKLFEHEYHTLAQLAHPRIVEVYDYSVEDGVPYYTMELLDGGDLREIAPIPWKQACSILRDICSSLSLLHSRRLVHRDLTPRNIRCTKDGRAKLLDLGAMVPMGPVKHIVGTPSFTAPEVIHFQPLDARTDLFSLGATAYFALTKRHAFPATNFKELRNVWRSKPYPPSNFNEFIPKELDNLVLSLLNIDPIARPVNAAEVMERLSAIADLKADEQLCVSQSYLSTPTLVGRDQSLLTIRKAAVKALGTQGSTVAVQGRTGVGRSRFLNACVLEGKLLGAIVLKADASDALEGNWGVVKAIITQLLSSSYSIAIDTAAPYITVLGHFFPEVLNEFETDDSSFEQSSIENEEDSGHSSFFPSEVPAKLEQFDSSAELRPKMQIALCEWLLDISSLKCIMIVVDDIHRIDEPSAAFLAFLANNIGKQNLLMVVALETDAKSNSPTALRLLRGISENITLENLNLEQTSKLLGSIFGDVPNVQFLVDAIFALSHGNPRTIIELAQHLLNKGIIRYQEGAWTLPTRLDRNDLPNSLQQALEERIESLEPDAQQLAAAMSLSPVVTLSREEMSKLVEFEDHSRFLRAFDDLVAASVLSSQGDAFTFSHQGYIQACEKKLSNHQKALYHLRLSKILNQKNAPPDVIAWHLLDGDDYQHAIKVIVDLFEPNKNYLLKIPQMDTRINRVIQMLEKALSHTKSSSLMKRDHYVMRFALVQLSSYNADLVHRHAGPLIEQLKDLTGLALYEELDTSIAPLERIQKAQQIVQARYDESDEKDRILSPQEAIGQLAMLMAAMARVAGATFDYKLWKTIPSIEPLILLSPGLHMVSEACASPSDMIAGRHFSAMERWQRLIDAGYEEPALRYGLGLLQASYGIEEALTNADRCEEDPAYRIQAWRIRIAYFITVGKWKEAKKCENRAELLSIQHGDIQHMLGTELVSTLTPFTYGDDLIGVKQIMENLVPLAERYSTYMPILIHARAEYHRIRADFKQALAECERALTLSKPGRHLQWDRIIECKIQVLSALDRYTEASELAQEALNLCEKEKLLVASLMLKMRYALISAILGNTNKGISLIEYVINSFNERKMGGIRLGRAYEVRARIAILMKDRATFVKYVKMFTDQFKNGQSSSLSSIYEKLLEDARQAELLSALDLSLANNSQTDQSNQEIFSSISTMLTLCKDAQERAQRSLEMLVEHSGARGGYLYIINKRIPVLSAKYGDHDSPVELEKLVQEYIQSELHHTSRMTASNTETDTTSQSSPEWISPQGYHFYPLLLSHHTKVGFMITGLVIFGIREDETLDMPWEIATTLSHALFETGDVI